MSLPPRRVGLHAARIGGGAAAAAVARSGGEPPLAPVGVDLDDVTAAIELRHRALRQATLDHEHAWPRRAWPERDREMLGEPGRRVDRLLQVHLGVDGAHEQPGGPLIFLVAAGGAPGEVGFSVAQRERGRERGARPLSRRQRGGMAFLYPEHLRTRTETEAEL